MDEGGPGKGLGLDKIQEKSKFKPPAKFQSRKKDKLLGWQSNKVKNDQVNPVLGYISW